ncbi:Endonuclease/exonuclease/phosphatase [Sporodiniella umbellata]|nr:Endonuclease/exonuclease/phosphatase [Sporodiniella umbellata]
MTESNEREEAIAYQDWDGARDPSGSYASSVISTQSAPPPYELYPPAKNRLGRWLNRLRQIPRLDPRWTLPVWVDRYRLVWLTLSFAALLLFSFLWFCSVFFSPSEPPPPSQPDLSTQTGLRVLTLNMMMRPPWVRNNWSDYKEERLAYIERYVLPEYDVILFQEAFAFASRRKDHLIATARHLGFNYHVESERKYPWDLAIDGGLLILSRFPIRASHTIEYPRGSHTDWLTRKGALHALIQPHPHLPLLHLFTTQTQADYDLPHSPTLRLAQFEQLAYFIHSHTATDSFPILLTGDMNVDAARVHPGPSAQSSPAYRHMLHSLGSPQDPLFHSLGYHPITLGDVLTTTTGHLIPAETLLTHPDQWLSTQSVDRLLWFSRNATAWQLLPNVEKFLVRENQNLSQIEKNQAAFTQVSDHYGLSCFIKL